MELIQSFLGLYLDYYIVIYRMASEALIGSMDATSMSCVLILVFSMTNMSPVSLEGPLLKPCTAPHRSAPDKNLVPHLRKFPFNVVRIPHLTEVIGISYLHNIKLLFFVFVFGSNNHNDKKTDIYLMLISCQKKSYISNILRFYNNNNIIIINDNSNKIIIPWQITIHFTFFSFQNVCMFFNFIETNSYCAAYFFL